MKLLMKVLAYRKSFFRKYSTYQNQEKEKEPKVKSRMAWD